MIQVTRTSKPPVLSSNETKWLAEYIITLNDYQSNKNDITKKAKESAEKKYNHLEVKTALKDMFSNKCAYCESHITHIDYGDIEHYKPKSKFPSSCFDWDNLLLGCSICNGKLFKGDKFPDASDGGPFVNPVNENPIDFFEYEYDPTTGTANVIPKNIRGKTTEKELGLNRSELVRHRSSVVRKMVAIAIKASKGDADCRLEILRCCNKEEEYAAFARYLKTKFSL